MWTDSLFTSSKLLSTIVNNNVLLHGSAIFVFLLNLLLALNDIREFSQRLFLTASISAPIPTTMVNSKKSKATKASQPTTLNPDMTSEIMKLMQQQGVELDAEALKMLTQVAGKEFEQTYNKIVEQKDNEGKKEDSEKMETEK